MADLFTIPSQTAVYREAQHPAPCRKRGTIWDLQAQKYQHSMSLALSFWTVSGEGPVHSHAWQHSLPHPRPLTSRLTGVGNHSATEKDTVLKLVNVFWFVSIFITRWEEDGDVLYIILGHVLDQSFGREQERREYLDHADKTTENTTITQILPLNTRLLNGGSWVNTSLVTAGVLKV